MNNYVLQLLYTNYILHYTKLHNNVNYIPPSALHIAISSNMYSMTSLTILL